MKGMCEFVLEMGGSGRGGGEEMLIGVCIQGGSWELGAFLYS